MLPIFLKNGRAPILLHDKAPLFRLACQALNNWARSSLQLYPLPHGPQSSHTPLSSAPQVPQALTSLCF